jgi:hypothetical protein
MMDDSSYPALPGRKPDFADLSTVRGQSYVLVRNAHLVMRLSRAGGGWQQGAAWSYAAAENDPRWAYVDQKYGMAEGLAIDDSAIYVVIDNNKIARASAANDLRPTLFVFERPRDL